MVFCGARSRKVARAAPASEEFITSPAFFKHSLVSLAKVRAVKPRDACVRFRNVRVGGDRPGALAGEKAATDGK